MVMLHCDGRRLDRTAVTTAAPSCWLTSRWSRVPMRQAPPKRSPVLAPGTKGGTSVEASHVRTESARAPWFARGCPSVDRQSERASASKLLGRWAHARIGKPSNRTARYGLGHHNNQGTSFLVGDQCIPMHPTPARSERAGPFPVFISFTPPGVSKGPPQEKGAQNEHLPLSRKKQRMPLAPSPEITTTTLL